MSRTAEIRELRAENERLRQALRPFAEVARNLPVFPAPMIDSAVQVHVTPRQLLAAAAQFDSPTTASRNLHGLIPDYEHS